MGRTGSNYGTDNRGPDFITIDGGEGVIGATPPSFANHVSLPWV